MQKKIMNHPNLFKRLNQRIQQAKKQSEFFSLTHPTVVANLADIYLDAISPFNFRIMMWGNQRILGVNENMEKIRVLLLAGIRSTVLWRQVGGSRWQLLFSRSKIKTMAEKILAEIEVN
jgi:high frequency lysogenization protein